MNTRDVAREEQAQTVDSLFSGAVICRQFRDGYRFSLDAVLAAHFHQPARGEVILDLGAGCGIISLILMYRWQDRINHIRALEYQERLCRLTGENFRVNGFAEKCSCIQGDVKHILEAVRPESFTHVVCNPPYYPADAGRKSKGEECLIARHLVSAELDDFTAAAAAAVKNGGTVVFIYPAEFCSNLFFSLLKVRLEIKQLQWVYSYPDSTATARLVLVKCVKNGGTGVKVLAPLYIYKKKNGEYSEELERLYAA